MSRAELLFDLGGVLLENDCFNALNALLPEKLAEDALKQLWLNSGAMQDFDSGHISVSEFAQRIVSEWQLRINPAEFIAVFYSWPRGFYPGAITMLGRLRESYRVSCLSNSNEVHWEKFNSFNGIFDIALSSHHLGVTKPAREIFIKALDILGSPPEQVIFFDDSLPNVTTARGIGIQAHHVQNFYELSVTLKQLE